MSQAAALLVMLSVVATAAVATRLGRTAGLAAVGACALAALAVLVALGGEVSTDGLGPVLMVLGYAALAVVLNEAGVVALAARRGGLAGVGAAAGSWGLGGALQRHRGGGARAGGARPGELAGRRRRLVHRSERHRRAAPQGSPTNLLVIGEVDFVEYLSVSVAPTAAMLAVAVGCVWAAWTFVPRRAWVRGGGAPSSTSAGAPARWTGPQRMLAVLAALAVVLQPVFDAVGLDRAVLGVVLLAVAVVAAAACRLALVPVLAAVPWQLVAVVAVLVCGAGLLSGGSSSGTGGTGGFAATWLVAALGTDILAAALAAPLVATGQLVAGLALVAVSAGAFATPVGSMSGILVLDAHRVVGHRASVVSFALAAVISVLAAVAGGAVVELAR